MHDMPRPPQSQQLQKVLLLGSGGLKISQAGEFDYSGSQAIKALQEVGIFVVLVNPNIATIQTDARMADRVYFEPLDCASLTRIIAKEKPDAILLSFGGQTALNLGLELADAGILAEHGVTVLGSSVETSRLAEDRDLFKQSLTSIGVNTAKSECVTTVDAALAAADAIGYPVMLRTGFTLGGMGSGIVEDAEQCRLRAQQGLAYAPQILIEECLLGWGEFEYEIIRDCAGNTVTVCNMENFDPMGIHTGESIVVAPSQTLDNDEYHMLREIAIKVATHFNIIGECNIQYAYNQKNAEYRVIEINPRLSRSSALASKATGYPLAFVAAKLALGYQLHQIPNSVTKQTCAFFEPALDYIVVKIPRWDTHKLRAAERTIGTEMKSVGEVMAIGRSFKEAMQKAIGMLNIGASCFGDYPYAIPQPFAEIEKATDRRIFALYDFFKQGGDLEQIITASNIHPWFLRHIQQIAELENALDGLTLSDLTPPLLLQAKQYGFSDKFLAKLLHGDEQTVRAQRIAAGVVPYVKQVDTLAGEFAADTNYLYLTYHGQCHDLKPSAQPPVVVLGSGPYSIGSSVEFDWCAVNTARTLREHGEQAIMINSNPETVSTDYDESDRLYFEQLTFERVQDIADFEQPKGVIVAVGGQAANNLALPLSNAGYTLLGTSAQAINNAENRQQFSALLNELKIDQPQWASVTSIEVAREFAERVGYPVLLRPSYVLSGAAMNVVANAQEMQRYLQDASLVSPEYPVVVSKFIQEAKELQIDGVAEQGQIVIYAISEHIENAGVHSGDATIVMPPQRLYLETIRRAKRITQRIVAALGITGPFNMQFLAKNNQLKVIECNLRASRSFPFASKVTGYNFIGIATKAMLGTLQPQRYDTLELDYVAVKSPQFSYSRLKGANPVAHVEMASTGEVACIGDDLLQAYYKSWQATGQSIAKRRIFLSVGGDKKSKLLEFVRKLDTQGWEIYTTSGTHDYLAMNGIASHFVYKASEQQEPGAATLLTQREVDLIINIPRGERSLTASNITDGYQIRRLAIDHNIPLITNLQSAQLMLQCLTELDPDKIPVKAWRDYVNVRTSA